MSFDAIVIGTGFGASVAATRLAKKGKKVLMLERGTWWVTPEKLGKPPVSAKKPIPVWAKENNQPLQYWPRPDHREGLLDFFAVIMSDFNSLRKVCINTRYSSKPTSSRPVVSAAAR